MVQPDTGFVRPDAVRDFRTEMERLFNTFVTAAFPTYIPTMPAVPQNGFTSSPIDVEEHAKHYLISMDLPGVQAKDVEVTITGSMLTVVATRHPPAEAGIIHHVRERNRDLLRRTFRLTDDIDYEAITATINHGEVQVMLPKSRPRTVRHIPIRSDPVG